MEWIGFFILVLCFLVLLAGIALAIIRFIFRMIYLLIAACISGVQSFVKKKGVNHEGRVQCSQS